ncbi:hypothetical protein BCF33_1090 [Hasllibacter halocynthiae]|uniref:Uncharacterized protein n=1 Tax=Hasllibacter halocynthiae TaxID=595589 RepID=A0A2T0X948_9RHOB|nr:hypothetical protein [Hasllibacter halocynthiae]PRY95470.1 hypothetical protein BCF33_1090 [Hasllibacter halocynthiae]
MILFPPEIAFEACTLRIVDSPHDKHVETAFRADGATARADVPWGDADHIAAAWNAGYGGDQWRMVVEHEVGHAFMAEARGLPHSWSVWAAAHGRGGKSNSSEWPARIREEEHLVVALQRYANRGIRDEFDALGQAFGKGLPALAQRFVRLVRPWLREGYDEPYMDAAPHPPAVAPAAPAEPPARGKPQAGNGAAGA